MDSQSTQSTQSNQSADPSAKKPVVCIVVGMAGSGKTTFVQRLNSHVHENKIPSYLINLDPAVAEIPYGANIDIRDSVNFKQVMKQYGLGPNGGIMTSLNLFATRFDQVLQLVEKRAENLDFVVVDTPGQIEIFTWSASGAIITESIASSFPTVMCFVVDTPNCTSPSTFMSNMLYACSILYKTKLPMIIVFNKTDVTSCDFAVEWMKDYTLFDEALSAHSNDYMGSLNRSMSLVLDEFYQNLKTVGVSAVTGDGMDDFFTAVKEASVEYETYYVEDLKKRIEDKKKRDEKKQQDSMKRLRKDLEKTNIAPKDEE